MIVCNTLYIHILEAYNSAPLITREPDVNKTFLLRWKTIGGMHLVDAMRGPGLKGFTKPLNLNQLHLIT